MTRGLGRTQIGVTAGMIESFGELVFELSHNVQDRRGDPIRKLDFAAIEAQRAALGLSDREIASRLGLTHDQVTYIRNLAERRHFVANNFQRLLGLGGNRRFREERFVPHEARPALSETALGVKSAMRIDPARTRRYVEDGWWSNHTLAGWLAAHAAERPDVTALDTGDDRVGYGELNRRMDRLAAGLLAAGLGRGDVGRLDAARLDADDPLSVVVGYLALARIGAVTMFALPDAVDPPWAAPVDLKTPVEGDPAELPAAAMPAAADPLYLAQTGDHEFAVHTGHTALGTARATAAAIDLGPGDRMVVDIANGPALLHLALAVGATAVLDGGDGLRPPLWGLPELPIALLGTEGGMEDGFAGRPAPGVEVRLSEDRELELSGAPLSVGRYWNAAPESIAEEGWLGTGLEAEIGDDGVVRLTP